MLCTQNSGFLSNLFNKGRGVNQGCPASPGIFTQTCAIIEHLIAENKNIRGISFNGIENLLSQFADDTGAFLRFEELCIEGFCNILQTIEDQLGPQCFLREDIPIPCRIPTQHGCKMLHNQESQLD